MLSNMISIPVYSENVNKIIFYSLVKINFIISDDCGKKEKLSFLDLLLEVSDNDPRIGNQEIREEVDTFMFAVINFYVHKRLYFVWKYVCYRTLGPIVWSFLNRTTRIRSFHFEKYWTREILRINEIIIFCYCDFSCQNVDLEDFFK